MLGGDVEVTLSTGVGIGPVQFVPVQEYHCPALFWTYICPLVTWYSTAEPVPVQAPFTRS